MPKSSTTFVRIQQKWYEILHELRRTTAWTSLETAWTSLETASTSQDTAWTSQDTAWFSMITAWTWVKYCTSGHVMHKWAVFLLYDFGVKWPWSPSRVRWFNLVVHLPVFGKMFRGFGGTLGSTLLCFSMIHGLLCPKNNFFVFPISCGFSVKCFVEIWEVLCPALVSSQYLCPQK
jgi:hypothetical protein